MQTRTEPRTPTLLWLLAPLAAAALAACSTLPADNAALQQARSHYKTVQANPQSATLAPAELRLAGDALAQAEAAWSRSDKPDEVNHLAYVADQRSSIAEEAMSQKMAESASSSASADRDRMRLAARTNEADTALRQAATAQRGEQQARQQANASMQQADASQRQTDMARRQTLAALQQSSALQDQADVAGLRNTELAAQIRDLNARQTPRGLVLTIGDVLFDTAKSELKPGAERHMDKLVSFLKQYPKRKALVEGFTDSVGSEASNQALSGRRADAVRTALLGRGVQAERVSTHGYGESFPVAGNDTSGGRQSNRRVEIILSDENGGITAR